MPSLPTKKDDDDDNYFHTHEAPFTTAGSSPSPPSSPESSSSLPPSRKRRITKNTPYTTFDNDNDDEHDDNKRRRHANPIYGVFGSSSDDDDYGDIAIGGNKRKRRNNGNDKKWKRGLFAKEVTFVKSSTTTDEKNTNDEDDSKKTTVDDDDKERLREKLRETVAEEAFLSFLNRGKVGKRRPVVVVAVSLPAPSSTPSLVRKSHGENKKDSGMTMTSQSEHGGIGLGFNPSSSSTSTTHEMGFNMPMNPHHYPPSSFFPNRNSTAASNTNRNPNPNIGKWEKHTKGIGMKLLTKMGFSGSGGLGRASKSQLTPKETTTANDTNSIVSKGISRPVEVLVRPANLGLGYGNFKEASQLKVNKTIEKEVRGITNDDEEEKKKTNEENQSLLDKLLEKERRSTTTTTTTSQTKQPPSKKIQKRQIIDKRPPPPTTTPPPLGEELLHNLTLLIQIDNQEIQRASTLLSTHKQKIARLRSEKSERHETNERARETKRRLERAIEIANRLNDDDGDNDTDETTATLEKRLDELESLLPSSPLPLLRLSVVAPRLNRELTNWNPLRSPEGVLTLTRRYGPLLENDDELLERFVVPHAANYLEHSWDGGSDVASCVRLLEMLSTACDAGGRASRSVDELLATVVYPRVIRVIRDYRPPSSLHSLALPWFQSGALRRRWGEATMGSLATEVRRKLRSVARGRAVEDGSVMEMVRPWMSVWGEREGWRVVGEEVVPRLARFVRRVKVDDDGVGIPKEVEVLNGWEDLLPPHYYASLWEGEVLPTLLDSFETEGRDDDGSSPTATVAIRLAARYRRWKSFLPRNVLENDERLCAFFYRMLQIVKDRLEDDDGGGGSLNGNDYCYSSSSSYRSCLARRIAAANRRDATTSLRDEIDSSSRRRQQERRVVHDPSVTFRQVVEDYANEWGVLFRPKMTGSGTKKDGKQVYLFGTTCVYLDRNVVMAKIGVGGDDDEWKAVGLEELKAREVGNND